MKSSLRKAIASVVFAGASLASAGAYADVALPNTGNGGVVLFVRNEVTLEVYARDLQISLNDVVTEAVTSDPGYTGPTNIPFVLPAAGIGPDALLTSFLSDNSATYSWGLLAGDSVGTNAAGTRRYLLTTQADLADPSAALPINNSLASLGTNEGTFFTNLNSNLPDSAGSSVRGVGGAGGLWGAPGTSGAAANIFFGQQPQNSGGPTGIGNPLNLFVLTSAGGGGALTARVFGAADLTLAADGTLASVVATPPTGEVPLPAAVWLLGSGLVGLAGIGRRRRQEGKQA